MKKPKVFHLLLVMLVLAFSAAPLLRGSALEAVPSPLSPALTTKYFAVGPGGADVIPHQIVRAGNDRLYIVSSQQSSMVMRMYRTIAAGLPDGASAFAAPVQITETSYPIGVDAVYDGGSFIHVLMNLQNHTIKDYPFDLTTNTFKPPIVLATDGGTVSSSLYIGTSGAAGMQDLSGRLHLVYWTSSNHILHRSYVYDGNTNILTPASSFVQVDAAGSSNHPAIAVSPVNNSVTVAWVSEADNPPRIRTRTRAGNGVWGSVLSASTASVWTSPGNGINIDQGPSLIVDASGVKHMAYIQGPDLAGGGYDRIHYVVDSGAGWVDQALGAFTHDPAVAINSAGEVYILGHGHPSNVSCQSMLDMCMIKKNSNGTWGNPQLFAAHPGANSFDASPSVKWSAVGFNRADTIEFIFFSTPYDRPTLYYGRIGGSGLPAGTIVDVSIRGTLRGTYPLAPNQTARVSYTGLNSGPVKVQSTTGMPIVASERVAYFDGTNWTSFSELMGLPSNQLTTSYVLPWYNNAELNTQLRFGNVGTAGTFVTVKVGGVVQGTYFLAPSQSTRISYPGLNSGPVVISSSGNVPIIASERVAYFDGSNWTDFSELMALPSTKLTTSYTLPWYNNAELNTQLRFGNVGTAPTNVTVTVGGVVQGTYYLAPSQALRVSYTDLNSGPVKIQSSGGVPIIASERVAYFDGSNWTSFSELMGLPSNMLTTSYVMPYYNNAELNTQLRFGNVGTAPTNVTVTVGGVVQGTYFLAPSQALRVSYAGLNSGPVKITSSGGVPIVASERVAYFDGSNWTSFSELMGLPSNVLTTSYVMPWYNNAELNTQLRFGAP